MVTKCPVNRSIGILVAVLAVSNLLILSADASAGQKPEVQRLFQSGSFEEAAQAAQNGDPATLYVAAQAMVKGEQVDRAREQYAQLKDTDDQGWRLVAESGEALLANDISRAVTLARQATEASGDNPFGFYQLGLAASRARDWGAASSAFGRSLELKPDFAYAHYYSALAHQRQRQLSAAADHFSAFLRLAPEAPERQAVQAIMRTLK